MTSQKDVARYVYLSIWCSSLSEMVTKEFSIIKVAQWDGKINWMNMICSGKSTCAVECYVEDTL